MNTNTLSINKYDSLLCKILIEEKETRAQNIQIMSHELINSSSIRRKSTFRQKYPSPAKLNILPPPCRLARIIQRKSESMPKPTQKTLYMPNKNRKGQQIFCLSPIGADFEKWRTIR